MQFPDMTTILADATDPAKHGPIFERDPADATYPQGFAYFLHSRCQVGPRIRPVGSKALYQQGRHLINGRFIIRTKINYMHSFPSSSVPSVLVNQLLEHYSFGQSFANKVALLSKLV